MDTADVLGPHRLGVNQLSQTLEHVLCDVWNHRRLQNQQSQLCQTLQLTYSTSVVNKEESNTLSE